MLRKVSLLISFTLAIAWLLGVLRYWVKSTADVWAFASSIILATPIWLILVKAEHEDKPTKQTRIAKYILSGLAIVNLFFFFTAPELDSHFIDLITLSSFYGVWFLVGEKIFKYFS